MNWIALNNFHRQDVCATKNPSQLITERDFLFTAYSNHHPSTTYPTNQNTLDAIANHFAVFAPSALHLGNIKSDLEHLAIEPPENLRDFVWMPAHIQWETEGESFVLIPTRYPFSAEKNHDLALSRQTEWVEKGEGCFIGFGQRLFATDVSDYSLLDVRDIFFEQVSVTN